MGKRENYQEIWVKVKKNDRKLEENIYTKQKKNKDIFTVNVMTMRENRENATN